eukprot:COSAG06_NODE_21313_length_761_cov_1.344411_1_plen_106_part_10
MEVDGRSMKPQAVSQWTPARVGLLFCVTVVPTAFFTAGLSMTFPAAELVYEVEASVSFGGSNEKEKIPPQPASSTVRDSGTAIVSSSSTKAAAVPPMPAAVPTPPP